MQKDTRCSAFWRHTNIRSEDRVFPCCRYKSSVMRFTGDLDSILVSPEYQKLRDDSSAGREDPNCYKCFYEESLGKKSLRQTFNDLYAQPDVPKLTFLEIGFDNMCNLACDGCGPEFSSTWDTILKDAGSKISIRSTTPIESLPSTLEKIVFLGGEPLMNNRHRRLLSRIADLSKLQVTYNTNGSFLLDQETISLLKKCRSADFILSIDGYGDLNSTVRKNSEWRDILRFIDQIKTQRFGLSIHTVLHANNWFGLLDLQKFVEECAIPWTINVLTYPAYLDIVNLPDSDKKNLSQQLKLLRAPYNFIINHLQSR